MKHTPKEIIEQCVLRWQISAADGEFVDGELSSWTDAAETILAEFEKEVTPENIQAIANISQEKTYIFLTVDGQTKDGTGEDVENCQMLAIAKGEDALTAYNNMLNSGWLAGQYDTCFCYELTSENMASFDLISHNGMSDKSCPECDETLCQDMSDNVFFCTECGYYEGESDTVYHCDKCGKAVGLSDFLNGDGKCVECNNQ